MEFEVIVSALTLTKIINLNQENKDNIRLLTAYFHKEETAVLYGFYTDDEKDLFYELLKVNGIGAKQALKILSNVSTDEFYSYLRDDNIRALSKVPGIGAKTAGKIILGIKSKFVKIDNKKTTKNESPINSKYADIIESLMDMGYEKNQIENALAETDKKILNENIKMNEEEIFKKVFAIISKNG